MTKCTKCNFVPRTDIEKAKSLMLSTAYELDGEYPGETVNVLRGIGDRIADGLPYQFEQEKINQIVDYAEKIKSTATPKQLIIDGVRWLATPILFLIILFTLVYLVRK